MYRVAVSSLIALSIAAADAPGGQTIYPGKQWRRAAPADVGMDAGRLRQARDYALSGGGSGFITRHGRLVMSWGDPDRRYDLKSTTKSIGVTALGLAIQDGKLKLADRAAAHHPSFGTPSESNQKTGWLDEITLEHLATQTAGFAKPGGYEKLLFRPGTKWSYSDGGPNWLAECVTLAYRRDLKELMFQRVFSPLGIGEGDLTWRNNAYRPREIEGLPRREFGSGISANIDAMARIGYLYLREGKWRDRQVIPERFVRKARTTVKNVVGLPEQNPERHGNASDHYGLLWWNNADGTIEGVPRDAYWSWGLYDSLIVVFPSLDVVVSRAGKSWKRKKGGHYDVLEPFLQPIAASVHVEGAGQNGGNENKASTSTTGPPYPPSPMIESVQWAPVDSIVRKARGSDNWPITWADDGRLYTAYGDGWGFQPRVKKKLSLGLARIEGTPPDIRGENIVSETGQQIGDGRSGKKASGMLMVGGVLYMWVRNAGNSQLARSEDHGRTWQWSQWRFETSFGAPTFLNFGRNYAGARDDYVYVYSHDSGSAYRPADRMVLARVPSEQIMERDAYEFFVSLNSDGMPAWTRDIDQRGAVFQFEKRCYRSGISYDSGIGRYLWCQTIPGGDTRFRGGFAIYDAPQPWGPWTTAFYTDRWDVGPGETQSFPTKWMSRDGTELFLVFSGDDCFSVRKAKLVVR